MHMIGVCIVIQLCHSEWMDPPNFQISTLNQKNLKPQLSIMRRLTVYLR